VYGKGKEENPAPITANPETWPGRETGGERDLFTHIDIACVSTDNLPTPSLSNGENKYVQQHTEVYLYTFGIHLGSPNSDA
jgi:hypothetical protein